MTEHTDETDGRETFGFDGPESVTITVVVEGDPKDVDEVARSVPGCIKRMCFMLKSNEVFDHDE